MAINIATICLTAFFGVMTIVVGVFEIINTRKITKISAKFEKGLYVSNKLFDIKIEFFESYLKNLKESRDALFYLIDSANVNINRQLRYEGGILEAYRVQLSDEIFAQNLSILIRLYNRIVNLLEVKSYLISGDLRKLMSDCHERFANLVDEYKKDISELKENEDKRKSFLSNVKLLDGDVANIKAAIKKHLESLIVV